MLSSVDIDFPEISATVTTVVTVSSVNDVELQIAPAVYRLIIEIQSDFSFLQAI